MTFVSCNIFAEACEFIRQQTPPSFSIEIVKPGDGYLCLRSPSCIVAVPEHEDADYFSTLCALFHEYGHWLDMAKWIEQNCPLEKSDNEIALVLQNHPDLNSKKVEKYLKRRSRPDENMKEYHDFLLLAGVINGPLRCLNPDSRILHERTAWRLGLEGLTIKDNFHKGFDGFIASCNGISESNAMRELYQQEAEKLLNTYTQPANTISATSL